VSEILLLCMLFIVPHRMKKKCYFTIELCQEDSALIIYRGDYLQTSCISRSRSPHRSSHCFELQTYFCTNMSYSPPEYLKIERKNCRSCMMSWRLSSRIRIVGNDTSGKDKKFLSFLSKKRDKSHHLIFW
jgi:hypothetical protein